MKSNSERVAVSLLSSCPPVLLSILSILSRQFRLFGEGLELLSRRPGLACEDVHCSTSQPRHVQDVSSMRYSPHRIHASAALLTASAVSALIAVACSTSNPVSPTTKIEGNYLVRSVNGSALPASATIPRHGTVTIVSGSVIIDADAKVFFAINTARPPGSTPPTLNVASSGTVTITRPDNYAFHFDDGSLAEAACTPGSCTIEYQGNSYVVTLSDELARAGP